MPERLIPSNKIYLANSQIKNAGRGVFAAATIAPGQLIEACPVVEVPAKEYEHLKATVLRDYYFIWGEDDQKQAAICLGFGSLYNHSYDPNATYKKDLGKKIITFVALEAIKPGEEITVNYNYGNPDDKSKLWIEGIPGPEE